MARQRAAGGRAQHALSGPERVATAVAAHGAHETTCGGADRPSRWALWFAARPALPAALRGTTAPGKPKKSPPRLPPNINERRNMHPHAERELIAYWRGYVVRECRRQAGMRLLQRARISAVIYRRSLNVADGSGDAERLKPLVDGLVEAGILKNDRRREVEYGEVREEHIGYRGYGLLLIVQELEPAAGPADVETTAGGMDDESD